MRITDHQLGLRAEFIRQCQERARAYLANKPAKKESEYLFCTTVLDLSSPIVGSRYAIRYVTVDDPTKGYARAWDIPNR